LLTDVRPAVHQQPFSAAFHQQRTAGPPVLRLVGIAFAPVGANSRNAGRRPAAEDRQLQLGLALLNSR
jgi:hypothetical protein